jgi:flagellar hook assembly protein FlgD
MVSLSVTLKIYDLLGREIKTLVDREMSAGNYTVTWNADDNFGKKVSTGIYLYSLYAGKYSVTRKMALIK